MQMLSILVVFFFLSVFLDRAWKIFPKIKAVIQSKLSLYIDSLGLWVTVHWSYRVLGWKSLSTQHVRRPAILMTLNVSYCLFTSANSKAHAECSGVDGISA